MSELVRRWREAREAADLLVQVNDTEQILAFVDDNTAGRVRNGVRTCGHYTHHMEWVFPNGNTERMRVVFEKGLLHRVTDLRDKSILWEAT